jgi:hypothetical protein
LLFGRSLLQKQAFLASLVLSAALSCAQQNKVKNQGASASATCEFADGKVISSDYSSPRVKGRKIFGGVVPYDRVWRPGADKAATFVTDTDLSVGGEQIPAGSYSLFALPATDKWILIISKTTGEASVPYLESEDLVRVEMNVSKTQLPVENFTLAYSRKGDVCTLSLSWEHTRATVDLAEKKLCWPTTTPLTYACPDQ